MNLKQQETKELKDDVDDPLEKPMDYQQFLEILDQSANNITPRDAPPRLRTPISCTPTKAKDQAQTMKVSDNKNININQFAIGLSSMPSTVKGSEQF
jgi:hypothetical protein